MEDSTQTDHAPAPGIEPKPWGIPALLAVLAIPLTLWGASLAIGLTQESDTELSAAEAVAGIIITILVLDGALIGGPLIVALGQHHLSWSALGFRPFPSDLWWVPLSAAGGCYVAVIIYGIVLQIFGVEPQQDVEDLFDSRAVLPLTAFATLIMAPLAEELFFRGFIFAGLIRPLGLYGAMAASGLLFGMFHVVDAESAGLVPAFAVVGAIFAWVYWRTGSLWPSIGAHVLFNSVSFILLASTAGDGS